MVQDPLAELDYDTHPAHKRAADLRTPRTPRPLSESLPPWAAFRPPNGRSFVVAMAVPNVTGTLHVGHALDLLLEDVVVRHRLQHGYDVRFPPGTDHAGLGAQLAAERELERTGGSRLALGLAAFEAYMRSWKERHERAILEQMRRLDLCADFERPVHSIDRRRQELMFEAFQKMAELGLVYRAVALTNFCPRCGTCVGGQEVSRRECTRDLYRIRIDVEGAPLELATLHLELLLGATALGVSRSHPDFAAAVGRRAVVPALGRELEIVEVASRDRLDPYLTLVLPSYNVGDFEAARSRREEVEQLYDETGAIAPVHSEFAGWRPAQCREALLRRLCEAGALAGTSDYLHGQAYHSLCDTPVVPRPVAAWFLRVEGLKGAARELLREGRAYCSDPEWDARVRETLAALADSRPNPNRWWEGACLAIVQDFSSSSDWILSRQSQWGYRVPAWHCTECRHVVITASAPSRCPECRSAALEPDPDVFDPLFHSALWAAMVGEDFSREPHADCAVLGVDILQFWLPAAELWAKAAFGRHSIAKALVHGLVCDAEGRKMSKTLGNGVDLEDVLARCSLDGLRATLFRSMCGKDGADRIPLLDDFSEGEALAVRLRTVLLAVPVAADGFPHATEWLPAETGRIDAALEACRIGDAYSVVLDLSSRLSAQVAPLSPREFQAILRAVYPLHPRIASDVATMRGYS